MHGPDEHFPPEAQGSNGVLLGTLPIRVRDAAALRGLGYSLREIADELEVSPQAVSLMLLRHRRRVQQLGDAVELRELSARAANVLGRHGIRSKAQARDTDLGRLLRGERNCGRKTLDEIARWIAATSPADVTAG